jgi:hypothetical protein
LKLSQAQLRDAEAAAELARITAAQEAKSAAGTTSKLESELQVQYITMYAVTAATVVSIAKLLADRVLALDMLRTLVSMLIGISSGSSTLLCCHARYYCSCLEMLFNKIQLLIRVTVLSHCDCMQAKLAAAVEAATAAALAAQAKIDAEQQAKAALEAELQV